MYYYITERDLPVNNPKIDKLKKINKEYFASKGIWTADYGLLLQIDVVLRGNVHADLFYFFTENDSDEEIDKQIDEWKTYMNRCISWSIKKKEG